MDMDREKPYHSKINVELTSSSRRTALSASLAASPVSLPLLFVDPPIRESSWLCRLFLWRYFCLSFVVRPVSSSTSDPAIDMTSPNSCSSLEDIKSSSAIDCLVSDGMGCGWSWYAAAAMYGGVSVEYAVLPRFGSDSCAISPGPIFPGRYLCFTASPWREETWESTVACSAEPPKSSAMVVVDH